MRRHLESTTKKYKPHYNSLTFDVQDAPYYDPYDIHIHKWTVDEIKYPQNHKEPLYEFNGHGNGNWRGNGNGVLMYCIICHEINIESMSTCSIFNNNSKVRVITSCKKPVVKNYGSAGSSGSCTPTITEVSSNSPGVLSLTEPLKSLNIFMREEPSYDEEVFLRV